MNAWPWLLGTGRRCLSWKKVSEQCPCFTHWAIYNNLKFLVLFNPSLNIKTLIQCLGDTSNVSIISSNQTCCSWFHKAKLGLKLSQTYKAQVKHKYYQSLDKQFNIQQYYFNVINYSITTGQLQTEKLFSLNYLIRKQSQSEIN